MRPLPAITCFKDIVEADLRRGARLIIKNQDEIDPQMRIATPKGDYWIAATFPADLSGRMAMLDHLAIFLAWHSAKAFTFVAENAETDAIYALGVSPTERYACLSRISRKPKPWTETNFSPVQWLDESAIDPSLSKLLPREPVPLTPRQVSAMEAMFGANGRFPALRMG